MNSCPRVHPPRTPACKRAYIHKLYTLCRMISSANTVDTGVILHMWPLFRSLINFHGIVFILWYSTNWFFPIRCRSHSSFLLNNKLSPFSVTYCFQNSSKLFVKSPQRSSSDYSLCSLPFSLAPHLKGLQTSFFNFFSPLTIPHDTELHNEAYNTFLYADSV